VSDRCVLRGLPVNLAIFVHFCAAAYPFIEGLPDICVFRRFFGFECRVCGMTRALSALLHGDLDAAWGFNRGVLVVFPMLCFIVAKRIWNDVKNLS
jgi:hypothetical protein